MSHRITRRGFATAGAATVALGLPVLESGTLASADEAGTHIPGGQSTLSVRPYQLMCVVCRIGAGCTGDLGDPRLTAILDAVRQDPKLPLSLRCNVDTVYRYQNPGHAEDTAEGELFNAKRDLDIVQKLGLVPGDSRPAIDMFERILAQIPQSRGICGYGTQLPTPGAAARRRKAAITRRAAHLESTPSSHRVIRRKRRSTNRSRQPPSTKPPHCRSGRTTCCV